LRTSNPSIAAMSQYRDHTFSLTLVSGEKLTFAAENFRAFNMWNEAFLGLLNTIKLKP